MQPVSNHSIDLKTIAFKAMIEYGFWTDFPANTIREVEGINPEEIHHQAKKQSIRDLRGLLWSSIDNYESLDLDQLEYCERSGNREIRVLVAVADVDEFVPKSSYCDQYAAHNCTSVYTGVKTFSMLPERLSTDLTSLKESEDRIAVVAEYFVRKDGSVRFHDVYRAFVTNKAKLVYEEIGDWLENKSEASKILAETPGLPEQIKLQYEACERLHQFRMDNGALVLESIEPKIDLNTDGSIDLSIRKKNQAHFIIEDFMIAANMTLTWFLEKNNSPVIQRVLKTPEQWDKIIEVAYELGEKLPKDPDARALSEFLAKRRQQDPLRFADLSLTIIKLVGPAEYMMTEPGKGELGHFGLAVQDYIHSTAPNRRYVDVITQRLVKAVLSKENLPYTKTELIVLADVCTGRSKEAKKVERFMRKAAGAILLRDRLGERFEAIITGASNKGTYARLISLPVEGRVLKGEVGLRVGDKVILRLINLEPEHGYIDFERSGTSLNPRTMEPYN